MTTPTQAQIEALQSIKKLRDETPGTNRNDYDAGYNRALEVCGDIAEAVLTAAAEAGENEIEKLRRQRIEFDCRYTMGKVADLTGNHCPIDKPCLRCQNERLEAATIERCAQVAERTPCLGYGKEPGEVIAAAIRALKDQP